MDEHDVLARRFDAERGRLRSVAYRMLGSLAEADDAVQEAWLRLARSDEAAIENLSGWLTTVVGRVCLDMLRARAARREDSLDTRLPDPVVTYGDETDPEAEALLADSVGLALLVVLETLNPAERLAFVLHDMFGVPFGEIGDVLGRSADAAKMMASRARRRVRGVPAVPAGEIDVARQRTVVDAFLAAARYGDFDALVAVLDPDVVLRADTAAGPVLAVGARDVAGRAAMFAQLAANIRPVLVNGTPGVLAATADGTPMSVMAFTVVADRIVEIDSIADPERLATLNLRFRELLPPPPALRHSGDNTVMTEEHTMKIAVAGATGRLGRHIAEVLAERGHEVAAISRAAGVDIITGEGLADAIKGAEVIVDAATGPSPEQQAATDFFVTAAHNLQEAGVRAGVKRAVVVSIIGTDKFTGGYGAAKIAHEAAWQAGPIPVCIVRAAQFHEFVAQLLDWGTQGDVAYVPEMRTQIVAARTVAELIVEKATEASGPNEVVEIAGPREEDAVALATLLAGRRGTPAKTPATTPVKVQGVRNPADPDAELQATGGLLPGPGARLAGPTFQEWLDSGHEQGH
ncbi:MAG TPA: sigma-70 family RNA polymerase sigma factor [Streptosporangiaceae bacterium]|nr:sigma-70 family RNA polymerase sigma factor [Streptosporangiaceae bacterium]